MLVRCGIYPFDVVFSLGESDESFRRYMRRLKVSEEDIKTMTVTARRNGHTGMTDTGAIMVRTWSIPNTPHRCGVLAHEIFHAAHFILDRVGMRLSMDSDEAFAYLIGYLTERVYDRVATKKCAS